MRFKMGIVLLLVSASGASAQDRTVLASEVAPVANWHLFTQSYGGTVSLLHGLTKHACEFAMNRVLGRPATDDEKAAQVRRDEELAKKKPCVPPPGAVCLNSLATNRFVGPGDIIRAECFQ